MPQSSQQHGNHTVQVGPNLTASLGTVPGRQNHSCCQQQGSNTNIQTSTQNQCRKRQNGYPENSAEGDIPVTAQWYVQIGLQPTAQTYVPAFPEVAAVEGFVWRVEVTGQMKAHQHTQANGNIRITREVGIYLQRIQEQGGKVLEPCKEHRIVEDPVYEVHRQIVAQDNLLYQSVYNPEDGYAELSATEEISAVQLWNKVTGLYNRTSHQLGEETYVEAEVEDIPDRFYQPFVNICRITDNLESVERDTNGQDNLIHAKVGCFRQLVQPFGCHIRHFNLRAQHLIQNVGKEVTILKVAQDTQVDAHTQRQPGPFLPYRLAFIYQLRNKEVRASNQHQQTHKGATCLVIEQQTDSKKIRITHPGSVLEYGKSHKYQTEERPELELREKQRRFGIESKYVLYVSC